MSFLFCDADKHEIIDIVENRQLTELLKYFRTFSKGARRAVKTICIDFYTPYMTLIKTLFPNAKIIVDRFHILQLLTRALSKTRVQTMKKFKKNTMEYKRLKKYRKLILQDYQKLDGTDFRHYTHFREFMSAKSVAHSVVSVDSLLEKTYEVYQLLLSDIKQKDTNLLFHHIRKYIEEVSPQFKTAMKTILKNEKYVRNSLISPYSNGTIEGINNYIKVLKRIASGYRSFFHFRNRILISRNLIKPKESFHAA